MKSASELSKEASSNEFAATFDGDELDVLLEPQEVSGAVSGASGSVSTDTRTLQVGQWYLAFKGENFDGHQFVQAAIKRGAAGCIVSSVDPEWEQPEGVTFYLVKDTLEAYHRLAKTWLTRVNPFVIAVTGSSGKTTTKEMCAAVVSSMRFYKSRANENNEFGLPKTILSMPPDTKVLVAEMAMRGLGQIAQLAETAKPDVGIITGVGTAHIELLGSAENIIIAKCEMLEQMNHQGLAVIGSSSQDLVNYAQSVFRGKYALFSDDDIKEIDVSFARTRFRIKGFSVDFDVNAHGIRHIQDAWCAIIAGRAAGLSDQSIAAGLNSYRSVEGRGNTIVLPNGAMLIDESYNANPDSVRCAVETMLDARAFPQKDKYIVLGEMAELGENAPLMHQQTGKWLKQKQFSALITVGDKAGVIARGAAGGTFEIIECSDQSEALQRLLKWVTSSDACVMIKGSHCANLDKLVADLRSSGCS
jgi:UDP-N-acetylmuramoyl-tripeptide--D-alanyl-D-alanine ligase